MTDLPQLKAIIALTLIIAGYLAYYFTSHSRAAKDFFSIRFEPRTSMVLLFVFRKTLGFVMLGLIPGLLFLPFFRIETVTFSPENVQRTHLALVMFILMVLIVLVSGFSVRKPDVMERIPRLRLEDWNIFHVLTSITGWGIYLLGYEFIFRQLLLFSWAEAYGIIPAITVNLVLYAVFHLPAGWKETVGSVPFGLVLCLVSLYTGSFWMAFLLHWTLSVSSEMFSIYYNPDMKFNLTLK